MLTIRVPSSLMSVAAGLVLVAAPVAVDFGRLATDGAAGFAAPGGPSAAASMAAPMAEQDRSRPDGPSRLDRFVPVAPAAGPPPAASVDVDTVDPTIAAAAQALSGSADRQLAALIVAALNGRLALAVPNGRDAAARADPPASGGTNIAAETTPYPQGSGGTAMNKIR